MGRRSASLVLLILACLWLCPGHSSGLSWNIFSSSSSASATPMLELDGAVADFSMDGNNNPRGVKLLENAQNKLVGPKNCWHEAYTKLFASCGAIMADKELQSRLAWHLSSCFQVDSGRPAFPSCGEASKMVHCRKRLGDSENKVFLEFFLETNTLCHQLQAEAFKHNTERLVNELSRSSKSAEEKLEVIEDRSEQIIRESRKVQDTLTSIETQAERLAETSKNVEDQIDDVLVHSRTIFDQSREIVASQTELKEGQAEMREKIDAGMERIHESYEKLGNGMDKLKEETVDIQKEIKSVGESMSSKMQDLQGTADEIGSVAGISLENQMQLLAGQGKAMDGLNSLYNFQSKALEESRETMQKLAQFGQRQQEELLSKQEQIRQAHEHLIQNSHSILEAQEEFRAKQANIFAALDKLYILHNAILAESRFIKAFFFYCCIVFLIYMLTSAKQTFRIRGQLYFGLCITLLLEMGLIRIGAGNFDNQFWVLSKVFLVRSLFLAAATIQILHSIFTFRDYELLNHRLLQTLVEKVRTLEENAGERMLSYSGSDESLRNYSWVFDELADEADSKGDPNYALPEPARRRYAALPEEVGENSITTSSRRYNLRPRSRH
ncbi:protein GAMETE EXPRESSED 1 isoform X2 [Brachypodium distachyon]|nr:protein GAMETE EXPRESSED 1 isoform X2 [Brachypodium distachyon]XP_014758374.1 protein GAMETE EXPRESSED 1 isoform X2 [Brachypodium distachyon]XP_014758375.1 protein GAMETE EXPRESSED 1 isoform X2 [Brachypodium distachyon]KQJ90425.1 hypothetical protein BRADI_4g31450v3 [Brachypodium distachyon]KQJ90426.1 hypothetical protein BRADI_4g31450v3 [Brachypodium distachyon]KQJ90427.1 hypothetical protein BRADI_4g31450v3 [Brachypodium distachyon]KQJ90429.1 hypothetical protein BRADI_4g31450v3 [Brachyp|eukprot:XP_010238219.1 protein GAMETE EXPRESSED 1 isoform X2 [Brachypodium distachyon]